MKVLYSASNYGEGGPGQIALHAHNALQRHLKPQEYAFLQPRGHSDGDHDALVSAMVLGDRAYQDVEVFHGFGNASWATMLTLGLDTELYGKRHWHPPRFIVERASTHPGWQYRALRKEESTVYGLLGRDPPTPTEAMLLGQVRQVRELELAGTIVIPSDHLVETFPEELRENCTVVQFGADLEKYRPAKERPSQFRVLWLGALWLRKGLYWLERAFSEEFAGVKDAELVTNASPQLRFPGVSYAHIQHLDYIADRQMPSLYQRSSVYCMPSVEEGQMISGWEAMASGLPCIFTAECGHVPSTMAGPQLNIPPEFWHDLPPVARVGRLRSALRYYYDNPSEVEAHGKNARAHAESRPWTKYEDELAKLWGA